MSALTAGLRHGIAALSGRSSSPAEYLHKGTSPYWPSLTLAGLDHPIWPFCVIGKHPVSKLCKFTSAHDSKPVYVNASQACVVYTYKGEPPHTIITFGRDFNLGVSESVEEVVLALDSANAVLRRGD
jgi:hypothetical protein